MVTDRLRVILVRHAESTANASGILQGHADFPLSERGQNQAELLGAHLVGEGLQLTAVYASPLLRAKQTCEIATAQIWKRDIELWEDLKEHDIGVFSGLTWAEIHTKFPDIAAHCKASRDWDCVSGAETMQQRWERGQRVVEKIFRRHANGDTVLLVAHGGFLQYVIAALLRTPQVWSMKLDNTCVFEFSIEADAYVKESTGGDTALCRIVRFGDCQHLRGDIASPEM